MASEHRRMGMADASEKMGTIAEKTGMKADKRSCPDYRKNVRTKLDR